MRNSPRRFVIALTILASLIFFVGSLVVGEHVTAQNPKPTTQQNTEDCEKIKQELKELNDELLELSADLARLNVQLDDVDQRMAKLEAIRKQWQEDYKNSLNPGKLAIDLEAMRDIFLEARSKLANAHRNLKNAIETDERTIQALKDIIADLLNKLGNCGAKTVSSPSPAPPPSKTGGAETPSTQSPPVKSTTTLITLNGVPGEPEDCAEFRRNYNFQKNALSQTNLSPQDRERFEKALENSRRGYCQCLIKNHISPLPEICQDIAKNPQSTSSPTPQPSPTPSQNANNQVGYHVNTNTANGLVVTTFDTPKGKIKVNLPDDMAAGDTITGTVEVEPNGKNEAERAQNQSELNGEVIEVGGLKTKVSDKQFTIPIPLTLMPGANMIILDRNGRMVATSNIPIANTQPPAPTQFILPTGGQQGRTIEIKGPCNGLFSPQDYVKIGGTIAPPLAESPRKIVVQNASNTVGPTNIECNENGSKTQCPFRNISINLSAPKLNLRRGETTTLHVEVLGLSGITQNLPLDLVNNSPNIISMTGGEVQHTTIPSTQVQPNGTYSLDRTLTGIMAGGFGITGTVTCTETCNNGPGGVIAGGAGPTAQPTPAPTPLTPTDTTSGEVCKWIAYKTYRVDEWKREQSSDKDLEVRHASAKGGGVTVEFHCKAAGTFTFTVTKEGGTPDVVSVTCTQP